MGAALGFLSGAAIGALGQYGAQKQQQKAQHEANFGQFMQQGVMSGQVDPTNPDAQKALKKYWGENYDAGMQMLQARQAAKLQMEKKLQNTLGKGEPTDLKGWQELHSDLSAMRDSGIYAGTPQAAALDKHISFAEKQISGFQSREETDKNKQIQQQEFLMSLQEREQASKAMQGIAAMTAQANIDMKQFMASLASSKFEEDKQKNFNSAKQALVKQLAGLNEAIHPKSGNPGLNAEQAKPLIDNYNAQAKALAQQAKRSGVDYDPDEFKTVTAKDLPNHPFLGEYSSKSTTLESGDAAAAPITATNAKGEKIQWDGKAWVPVK